MSIPNCINFYGYSVPLIGEVEIIGDWLFPTLLNNWENYGDTSNFPVVKYRLIGTKRLVIVGCVKNGTIPTSDLFLLPAELRPEKSVWKIQYNDIDQTCMMVISHTGYVSIRYCEANSFVSLEATVELDNGKIGG